MIVRLSTVRHLMAHYGFSKLETACRIEFRPRLLTLDQYYAGDYHPDLGLVFNLAVCRLCRNQALQHTLTKNEALELCKLLRYLVERHADDLDSEILDRINKFYIKQKGSSTTKEEPAAVLDNSSSCKGIQTKVLKMLRASHLLYTNYSTFKTTGISGGIQIRSGLITVSSEGLRVYQDKPLSQSVTLISFWQIVSVEYFDYELLLQYLPTVNSSQPEYFNLRTYQAEHIAHDTVAYMISNMRINRLVYYSHRSIIDSLSINVNDNDMRQCMDVVHAAGKHASDDDNRRLMLRMKELEKERKDQENKGYFYQAQYQDGLTDQTGDCNSGKSFAYILTGEQEELDENSSDDQHFSNEQVEGKHLMPDIQMKIQEYSASNYNSSQPEVKIGVTVISQGEDLQSLSRRSSRRMSRADAFSLGVGPYVSRGDNFGSRRSIREADLLEGMNSKSDSLSRLIDKDQLKMPPSTISVIPEEDINTKVKTAVIEKGLEGKPNKEVLKASISEMLKKIPKKKT